MQFIDNFDIDLYDRQIRTYGFDAVHKISNSSVMVIGLNRGLETEIYKNLALSGIKNIYLYDNNNTIDEKDLETGYFYSKNDIGKCKTSVLYDKLIELNPFVSITISDTYTLNQNIIIINQFINFILEVDNYCKNNNIKLIVFVSGGVSGVLFTNAGYNHKITDITGEIIEPITIEYITNDGTVKCIHNHNLQSNDTIELTNLEGINIQQFCKEWTITIINSTMFKLNTFIPILPFNLINGIAKYIYKPITINHESFKQQLDNYKITNSFDEEYSKKLIKTYIQMYTDNLINNMPFIWSEENNIFMKKNNIILPDQARIMNRELIPVISIMGALTASETIKLITNKYMPINQWFTWTDNYLIPQNKPDIIKNINSSIEILYGYEFGKKINDTNIFIVGAGAIGCEHLKNMAFLNINNIIITDPDIIEKSNLNRQFLFRPKDIGQFKSNIASNVIKTLKPNINIISFNEKVGNDNIDFTDNIFNKNNKLTCVFNALDNLSSRKFMDEQCFKYNIPLFECGTNGTKGNIQPIIPFITETYSASSDPDQDTTFPVCTIKTFPNEIHHTIHWAMDNFSFFNQAPLILNKYLNIPNYLDNLSEHEKNIAIDYINIFFIDYIFTFDKINNLKICVKYAINMFIENYYTNIIKLLDTYKPDYETSPGILFWSKGKKCPTPIKFDINNELHLNYVIYTVYMLLKICNFNYDINYDNLKPYIYDYYNTINYDNINYTKSINNILPPINNSFIKIFIEQEFDKENKIHVEWISCCANLRALNYGIPTEDSHYIKGIAGHIIPAIATTTAITSGLIIIEFLKYLLDTNNVNIYKSCFINLADPIIIYSDTLNAPIINIAGINFNSWYKFEYNLNSTLNEFKLYYENIFKTTISMIVVDTTIIYADFIQEQINNYLYDIFNTNNVTITLISDDDINLPLIHLIKK